MKSYLYKLVPNVQELFQSRTIQITLTPFFRTEANYDCAFLAINFHMTLKLGNLEIGEHFELNSDLLIADFQGRFKKTFCK